MKSMVGTPLVNSTRAVAIVLRILVPEILPAIIMKPRQNVITAAMRAALMVPRRPSRWLSFRRMTSSAGKTVP